jgi:signal transduction histidine kinase
MRIARSQYNHSKHLSRDEKEKIPNGGTLTKQVIENADGVPFQLIFGPQIGEGVYLNTGDGITQLLGISPEDLTEKLFFEMIEEIIPLSADIPADHVSSRMKFLNGEIDIYQANVKVRLPGGRKRWILDTSVPIVDDETGKVIGATGFLYDDNYRKHILEWLVETRDKADESERLKTAFLRNISHEIRTPLNAIVGFSTLLDEYPDTPEKRKEYIEIISRSTDHLLEIIDDIVEISKIEAKTIRIDREIVDLKKILSTVYDQNKFSASEKGVILEYKTTPADKAITLYTDGYKITQVLRNLVNNALKFTGEGRVEFGYRAKITCIEFYVSDTGIGIPVEQQANIFNRFYQGDSTTNRCYGGTGLGLAISKAYVELLGGDIWFTSRQGEGTTFRFTIPITKGEGSLNS